MDKTDHAGGTAPPDAGPAGGAGGLTAAPPPGARTETAAKTALMRIMAIIQDNGLRPGDQIPSEGKLAQECGVSRGTIRESIRSLDQLGVLNVRNGRRAELAEISGDNIAILINHAVHTAQVSVLQTWDFRETIETRIARLAALRRTPAQVQAMRALCDEMYRCIDDWQALTRVDIRLHLAWAGAADNLMYLLNIQSLTLVMTGTGPIGYAAFGDQAAIRRHVDLHAAITDAIARQSAEDAVTLMLRHFAEARTCILDAGLT